MKKIGFLFIICFALNASAQKGWEIGGWLGTAWYTGDIVPTFDMSQIGPAAGIVAKRNFNERLSLTSQFNYARIGGDDAKSTNNFQLQRNLNFVTNIFEWSPSLEFNFFPYFHGSQAEYFTPYVYVGFSVFRFNPKSTHNDTKTALQPLGTEGQQGVSRYRLVTGGWAYGIGIKYDFNRDWSINAAINGRRAVSDYLDDVSTTYPNYGVVQSNSGSEGVFFSNPSPVDGFGETGTQRGDSKTADNIFMFSVSILRYFGRLECPPISTIKN